MTVYKQLRLSYAIGREREHGGRSPQHMGENVLAIVNHVANEADLQEMPELINDIVCFDLLGLFFVTYSVATAAMIHIVLGLLAIVSLSLGASGASRPSMNYVLSILVSFIAALAGPLVVLTLFVALGNQCSDSRLNGTLF